MAMIKAESLVFEYKPERGVKEINLSIDPGECFVLLGRNGSGKSTLTRLILGIERSSFGRLSVLGQSLDKNSRDHLNQIGAVLDTSTHWENLSGWQNAYFVAKTYGMPTDSTHSHLKELFTLADLSDRATDHVKSYSYGMRRKLSIIQALCHDPELLVLDEPTSGLDVQFLNRLSDLIRQRTRNGLSTWISGNDPEWVSGLGTSLAFIDSGRIVYEGTEKDLLDEISPYQKVSIHLSSHVEISSPKLESVKSYGQTGMDITVILEKDPMHIPVLLEWVVSQDGKISRIEVHQGTLRDGFLIKTGRDLEQ